MGSNWKNLADNAKSRSNIYGLLATVFREEPSIGFLQKLRSPRLSGVFSDLGVELGDAFHSVPEAELMESLGLEFARLFIGPVGHISAHESVFVEGDGGKGGSGGPTPLRSKISLSAQGWSIGLNLPECRIISVRNWCLCKWQQSGRLNCGARKTAQAPGIARTFSVCFLNNTCCAGFLHFAMLLSTRLKCHFIKRWLNWPSVILNSNDKIWKLILRHNVTGGLNNNSGQA